MYISCVEITNFRNFKSLKTSLKRYAVIVGANKAGKSNFIEAIRLVISPDIRRSNTILDNTDFWSGDIEQEHILQLKISVEITLDDSDVKESFVGSTYDGGNIARFSLIFQQKQVNESDAQDNSSEVSARYVACWRMGQDDDVDFPDNFLRGKLSFEILEALRDAEGLLSRWRKSPLKNLLTLATKEFDMETIIENILLEAKKLRQSDSSGVGQLIESLNIRGSDMVGSIFSMDSDMDISMFPNGRDDLLKLMQLYVDGNRPIDRTSLGTQNVLFLSLLIEEMQQRQDKEKTQLILGLEEPEAHVHPHTQRSLFRYFSQNTTFVKSLLITTHSTYIASVSPIESLIIFRDEVGNGTKASYLRDDFNQLELEDLRRYLDVTKSELVFSRGVIFVEGIAEQYIVPAFASALGFNLDHYGISVVPIHSTNFTPFIKAVLPNNFNIPFVVITDGDPFASNDWQRGLARARKLVETIDNDISDASSMTVAELNKRGIYIGTYTLEADLALWVNQKEFLETFASFIPDELTTRDSVLTQFENMLTELQSSTVILSRDKIENLVDEIEYRAGGKGRFAQRLAGVIEKLHPHFCPLYIQESIIQIVNAVEGLSLGAKENADITPTI